MKVEPTSIAAIVLFLLIVPAASAAPTCEGVTTEWKLTVSVEGVRSGAGLVASTLYADDELHYLKGNGALKVWRVPAISPATTMCIWLPHPGVYAIASYHDANSNLEWDHSRLGAIEGFGFSRNPSVFFSPPPLRNTRFTATAGETTLHVRLSYR